MKRKENRKPAKAVAARKTKVSPAKKTAAKDFSSELEAPRWSVVSFDNCLASSLTYEAAEKKMKRFRAKKISGLCIVTDAAAERIAR